MSRMQYIYGSSDEISIGRESWCDILIDGNVDSGNDGTAYIVRNGEENSWRIIRDADSFGIKVNGEPVHLVRYLKNGDRLEFEGKPGMFRFAESKDETDKLLKANRKLMRMASGAVAAIFLVGVILTALVLNPRSGDDIRRSELRKYENSILKISVKEVIYQEIDIRKGVSDTLDILKMTDETPSGSGFITEDGRFISARHCVEPWIIVQDPETRYSSGDILTRWAADAETFNITVGRDSVCRRLITICDLSRNGEHMHTFSSDTCGFHTENDLIRNLRGMNDPLYWRELGHIRSRSSLGDIISFKTSLKGRIKTADADLIATMEEDCPAVHAGYLNGHNVPNTERSRLFIRPQKDRCLEFKDTDVDKGMSGGPVMVRHQGKMYAVGVLSRILEQNKRVCFCVPITESYNTAKRWQE
ncbi:MAG: FHA domain-containing protein [Bacteroidales bacterium]|nr:FHA domain-containing protein [Bacteroidales bacterium]